MIAPDAATILALRSRTEKGRVHCMQISLAFPPTRFSQDFNIFRRKFTDSAEYPPYIYLASAIWANEWWDAP